MQIIASLNGTPLAVAALEGHGLLTVSVLSIRRHPGRQVAADNEALLVPELRCRLGGLKQSADAEEGFTVLEFPLVQGDAIDLALKPEKGPSQILLAPAREVWVSAEPPRFAVDLNGREYQIVGQPGYGVLSMLLVWADRHPSRCVRKNGEVLPQHQLQVQFTAHDTNELDVTRQHHWGAMSVAPTDTLGIRLLAPGVFPRPITSREHVH